MTKESNTNHYWSDPQGQALMRYNRSDDLEYRDHLYNTYLYPHLCSISKLWVDKLLGHNRTDDINSLITYLTMLLPKVDANINNGFSYINFSARNWCLGEIKKKTRYNTYYASYTESDIDNIDIPEIKKETTHTDYMSHLSSSLTPHFQYAIITKYSSSFNDSTKKNGSINISRYMTKVVDYLFGQSEKIVLCPRVIKLCQCISYEISQSIPV